MGPGMAESLMVAAVGELRAALVGAITQAGTLGASGTLAGTIDLPTLSGLLLAALGVKDSDEILARMFPDGVAPEPPPAPVPAPNPFAALPGTTPNGGDGTTPNGGGMPPGAMGPGAMGPGMAESLMVAAVKDLRRALVDMREAGHD